MAIPFQVGQIESLMPSFDARNSSKVFALAGENFIFDSNGPKSGFPSRPLTPFPFSNARDVHGRRVQDRTFVFCEDAILTWRTTTPFTWDYLAVFDSEVPENYRLPWSCIYMNGKFYFAHPYRGFFSATALDTTLRLWLEPETSSTILGLIPDVRAMDIVRGRAILVNSTTIQWSGVSDLTDLTPAFGGAGFQAISNFVKGTFIALTSFQDGFVVWTTNGNILAEYTGGDEVWRFVVYESREAPVSPWAIQTLINTGSVFLTRRGLMTISAQSGPQDWTPDFNEFLRDYLENDFEQTRRFRLDYDSDSQTIFLSESLGADTFFQSYALRPTLNKWGMFSSDHYGWLPLTQTAYGHVDIEGIPQLWTQQKFGKGVAPDNSLGYSRFYPRLEKQLNVASSSAVSRDIVPNQAVAYTVLDSPAAGWYDPTEPTSLKAYGRAGLNAWLEIGYLRPESSGETVDNELNVQEIVIGSELSAAQTPMDFTTEWNADYFYGINEDWNGIVTETPTNLTEDWNVLSGSSDWNYDPAIGNEDYQLIGGFSIDFGAYTTEDWLNPGTDEDWTHPISGLPFIDYDIRLYSSGDGITVVEHEPLLAKFETGKRTFGVDANGVFHRLRVSANDADQYFHLQYVGVSMSYAGKIT